MIRSFDKYFLFFMLFLGIAFFSNNASSHAPETHKLTLAGSTTVNAQVIIPHKDDVDKKFNGETTVFPSSSGRGLLSLIYDEADIAMISSSPDVVLKKLNEQGYNVSGKDLIISEIGKSEIIFVVHPQNPIKSLNREQIKGIFSGKIKDWNEFGHPELGIIEITTEHKTGAMFSLIEQKILKGPMKKDRLQMQNAPQVLKVVSQLPNTIGFATKALPKQLLDQTRIICSDECAIEQNLYFVYKKNLPKEKKENIEKLISLYEEVLK